MSSLPLNIALPIRNPLPELPSDPSPSITYDNGLDAFKDARQIVRLAQCPRCSYPLREPVTLPCGNSLCKKCIPETRVRENISYPATPNRLQGFICPFVACGLDHAIGDCSVNVVLSKIMNVVAENIHEARRTNEATNFIIELEQRDEWTIAGVSSLRDQKLRTRVLAGGRLVATYVMAEMGDLPYDSEVIYRPISLHGEDSRTLEVQILEQLKESIRSELDCQVCYTLLLEPLTTACGHTFCRTCLHRVLDHSSLCPVCRRLQAVPPAATADQVTSDLVLSKMINGLYPDALAVRAEIAKTEEMTGEADLNMPLFICTLSFPSMPTFLHIFEPRYRLMLRRAMESGERKFGMLLHNSNREPQGQLGRVPFYQYGTLLHIVNMHLLADGRSLIETVGISRFKVLKYGVKDDYTIGKIERIEDIPIAAEEALEAREIGMSSSRTNATPRHVVRELEGPEENLTHPDLDAMSTQALFSYCLAFVKKMREQSAPWLHTRIFQVFGECPEDPALFPWWFASVLPTADAEKYKLLLTGSVRERLKMCAGWISEIERSRCGMVMLISVLIIYVGQSRMNGENEQRIVA